MTDLKRLTENLEIPKQLLDNRWIALVFLLCLTSCELDKACSTSVKISFLNRSTSSSRITVSNGLDSVIIDATGNSKVGKELCFSESIRTDGNYWLKLSSPQESKFLAFGYYSNGMPSEKEFQITWVNDSVKLKSIPSDY
ncbi:MAG: hypothetical protein H7Y13_16035 [Sphingobacteriaceae bacterium]|nr:hypothetical protein [Sphingobacteriaceae bacterium]